MTHLIDDEPLLRENPDRYVVLPVQYPDLWEMLETHRRAFWSEAEIDLSEDLKDWNRLSEGEQRFIKHVLAFFAASDGIVMENLALRFFADIQVPEVRSFYAMQIFMETIHSITYAQLIDTYIKDQREKTRLFRAVQTIPTVAAKAEWAQRWIESPDSFATRLAAFACVEGIFFSGSFCCIYWLKERGVLPGLCKSNDFIARDEGIHTDFACLLYRKYLVNKLPEPVIHEIVGSAVAIEEEFVVESLGCALLGMNAAMMTEYIRFVANRLLRELGHNALFPAAKQPFSFMDRICFDSKTNFFEGRVTSYQMSVGPQVDGDTLDTLDFNAEF